MRRAHGSSRGEAKGAAAEPRAGMTEMAAMRRRLDAAEARIRELELERDEREEKVRRGLRRRLVPYTPYCLTPDTGYLTHRHRMIPGAFR